MKAVSKHLAHLRDKQPVLACHYWCHQAGRHLRHSRFSQEANPQPQRQISTEATEKLLRGPVRAVIHE